MHTLYRKREGKRRGGKRKKKISGMVKLQKRSY